MRYSNERELVMDRVRYAMMKREGCNEGDENNFSHLCDHLFDLLVLYSYLPYSYQLYKQRHYA